VGALFPTAAQWRDLAAAWRGRSDNELLRYGLAVRRRRWLAFPWWRRWLIALFGLAAVGGFEAVFFTTTPRLYGLSPLGGATAAAVLGIVLALLTWWLRGLFDLLSASACLLSRPGRRRVDLQADDALYASRLTDAELLLGLAWPPLRWALPPLLAGTALAVLLPIWFSSVQQPGTLVSVERQAVLLSSQGRGELEVLSTVLPPWAQQLVFTPLTWAGIATCGLLASGLLTLLAMLAGRRLRMDAQAGVIAGLYSVGTLGFCAFTTLMTEMVQYQYNFRTYQTLQGQLGAVEPLPFALWLAALAAAVLLPLRLVRRQHTALAVLYALPLLFSGSVTTLFYRTITLGRQSGFDPTHWLIDCFLAWSMFAVASPIAVPHPACLGSGFYHLFTHPAGHQFRWPLLLLAQLGLLCGLLRAALEGIAASRRAASA
jgi:hypothetical protein